MILDKLYKKGVISPPKWLINNTVYLTIMGSNAYSVSSDNSDNDVYGFCVPPKSDIFPHLKNEIIGFGKQSDRFEQYQQHHIIDPDSRLEYDFAIYSIVKYFNLLMQNNPNVLDGIWVPRRCIIHSTGISEHIRENRDIFLHKGCFYKFKGYAYSMMHKIDNKVNAKNEKRAADIARIGYDSKFAMHLVRLVLECEQILVEHTLDLEKNKEQLKSIRRGEWTLPQLKQWFYDKERQLEELYHTSTLPIKPNEDKIKDLLIECLEMHYGSLSGVIVRENNVDMIIDEMQKVIDRFKK